VPEQSGVRVLQVLRVDLDLFERLVDRVPVAGHLAVASHERAHHVDSVDPQFDVVGVLCDTAVCRPVRLLNEIGELPFTGLEVRFRTVVFVEFEGEIRHRTGVSDRSPNARLATFPVGDVIDRPVRQLSVAGLGADRPVDVRFRFANEPVLAGGQQTTQRHWSLPLDVVLEIEFERVIGDSWY